jgi:hypothetical protein
MRRRAAYMIGKQTQDVGAAVTLGAAIVIIATTVASVTDVALAKDTFATFPGPRKCVDAPSGIFAICNEDHDEEPNHSLFLVTKRAGTKKKLLDYGRNVEVSWAPDSEMFFVNDNWGSNASECLVTNIRTMKELSTLELVQNKLTKRESGADHLYVTCSGWNSNIDVGIVAHGYGGDGPPDLFAFDHKYTLDIASGRLQKIR